jgi:predicted dehydrogenase
MPDASLTGLRAGVVGPRGIGRIHIDSVRRLGVEVTAVAATSAASAQEMAEQLHVEHACESFEELVGREDVDVVHVCVPPGHRVDPVLAAIEAGKHVVSEKPLAISSTEARRLHDAAEKAGVVHAVTYNYRFYPMLGAMRHAVASGRLGRVHLVRGSYLLNELLGLGGADHWLLHPELTGPGLALADVGPHWWDMVEYVSGQRITEVICTMQKVREGQGEGEDSAAIMIRLDGGAAGAALVSDMAAGYGNAIELTLVGTEASAWWRQEDPEHLWVAPLEGPIEFHVRPQQPEGVALPPTLQLPGEQPMGYLDAFRDLMAAVYGAVANGGESTIEFPTFADGLRGVEILEALVESASTNQWKAV